MNDSRDDRDRRRDAELAELRALLGHATRRLGESAQTIVDEQQQLARLKIALIDSELRVAALEQARTVQIAANAGAASEARERAADDTLTLERTRAQQREARLQADLDAARAQRDTARAECEALIAERDEALAQRDVAQTQRAEAMAQVEAAASQLAAQRETAREIAQRELEAQRQRELEARRQRARQARRQRELEAQQQRELEAQQQRELEAQQQRELEAQQQRERAQRRAATPSPSVRGPTARRVFDRAVRLLQGGLAWRRR